MYERVVVLDMMLSAGCHFQKPILNLKSSLVIKLAYCLIFFWQTIFWKDHQFAQASLVAKSSKINSLGLETINITNVCMERQ